MATSIVPAAAPAASPIPTTRTDASTKPVTPTHDALPVVHEERGADSSATAQCSCGWSKTITGPYCKHQATQAIDAHVTTASFLDGPVAADLRRRRFPEHILKMFALPGNSKHFRFSQVQSAWADEYTIETNLNFEALPRDREWPRLTSVSCWPQLGARKTGDLFLATRKDPAWRGRLELIQYHGPAYEESSPHAWTSAETGCALWGDDYELLLKLSSNRDRMHNLQRYVPQPEDDDDLHHFKLARHSNASARYFAATVLPAGKRQVFSREASPKPGDIVVANIYQWKPFRNPLRRLIEYAAARNRLVEALTDRLGIRIFPERTVECRYGCYIDGPTETIELLNGSGRTVSAGECCEINVFGVQIDVKIWAETSDCVMF